MMNLSEFIYDLPKDFIAQEPLPDRDKCKLLLFNSKKEEITHLIFSDIKNLFSNSDLLILNNTKVIPARLIGEIELLLLQEIEKDVWEILAKPRKRAKVGAKFDFGRLSCEIVSSYPLMAKFKYSGNFYEQIKEIGFSPLPPYIKRKGDAKDKEFYQTVYAKRLGSIAAPTAGLHFTKGLLSELSAKGIEIGFITLHIGHGTFQKPKDGKMDKEYCQIEKEVAIAIKNKKNLVACGTSVVRCLESQEKIEEGSFWTDIFITPGYRFKWTDCFLTNFHLPASSPFIMTSAFVGLLRLKWLYEEAKAKGYRFASYGDAMLIV
ncbi:MAG: tRNA preQ1(34) S-adenosylmethionine ribosyltransferase-isomerase QueA [bacterium]|nr:tRNA preQ1(34) S-adenosylmethionine ribosyltransferase-isomerase QueA [bacterium]